MISPTEFLGHTKLGRTRTKQIELDCEELQKKLTKKLLTLFGRLHSLFQNIKAWISLIRIHNTHIYKFNAFPDFLTDIVCFLVYVKFVYDFPF